MTHRRGDAAFLKPKPAFSCTCLIKTADNTCKARYSIVPQFAGSNRDPIHAACTEDSWLRIVAVSGRRSAYLRVRRPGTGHGRRLAVKVVREDWADPITAVKLLQREARAGLSVRHPHLVKIFDVHVTRPPYFLVMEMLPGESLRSRLRRDYRLDTATALWITRQSAEALAALHRVGFIHGDVKPENIRLVDDGTAVLIDFGFAHRPGEKPLFSRTATFSARPITWLRNSVLSSRKRTRAVTCSVWESRSLKC